VFAPPNENDSESKRSRGPQHRSAAPTRARVRGSALDLYRPEIRVNGVKSSLLTFVHQASELEFQRAFPIFLSRAPDHLSDSGVLRSAK
jgi:hypothetical protein